MSSLANKQVKRKGGASVAHSKRSRLVDSDNEEEQTQPIPESQMEVDDQQETPQRPPLERMAPGAPYKKQSEDNEVHRTDDAEGNRNLLDNFNFAAAVEEQEANKAVIDEETKELVVAALPLLDEAWQARLKSVFLHGKFWDDDQSEVIVPSEQLIVVKEWLRNNPGQVHECLLTYRMSVVSKPAAAVLGDDEDALMASMLDETEKQLEEIANKPPSADIFTVAEELDKAYGHNLYFENPIVRDSAITFKISPNKKIPSKPFESFKLCAPEGTYQRFLDDVYYNLALITPPGLMELVNLPPFGNISEFFDSTKKKAEGKEVSKYAPKFLSDCKWSLNYTSKHFYLDSDKDPIEYDERTRKVYADMKEAAAKHKYMEEHPDCKSEYEVPLEAYEWKQEQRLTNTQLAELSETERFAKNSKTVNAHFYFLRTRLEDMYHELVKRDPAQYAATFKKAIETQIESTVTNAQTKENEAAKVEKRRPNRIIPDKFEDVLNRNLKSLIKTDKTGGHKTLKFSGKLFQAATDSEKAGLHNGAIKFDNEEITKICKENGLMPKRLAIYRLLTEEEMKENPTADTLHRISEAEANAYVRACDGKIIGQMVYSPGPMLISPEQMIYYNPKALIIWGAGNAYREPFQFQKAPERPKVEKRIFAPAPTVINNKKVDISGFATMQVPEAFAYKKKEEVQAQSGITAK